MSNTFFQKKWLKGAILSLILGLGILTYPFFIYANIPNDANNINFESYGEGYSTGNLNGQNSWTGSANYKVSNTSTYVRSGSQGVYFSSTSGDITFGNATSFNSSIGGIGWYNFSLKRYNTVSGSAKLRFSASPDLGFGISRISNNYDALSGTFALYTCDPKSSLGSQSGSLSPSTYEYHQTEGLDFNIWTDIALKFDLDDKLIWLYYKQEGMADWFAWSKENNRCFWINTTGSDDDFFDILKLELAYRYVAYDNFTNVEQGICTPEGSCSSCTTGESCINAGCIWEWNTGFERWECHQEWIPYVPGCGTGFQQSCYGCYTQETCESAIPAGVCEWVDRGYGTACYPVEEVPPEAVWEEPELENCDELSGVEQWLCWIKNFFAGLFMPTQEKVNELNLTINNFKTKFPFNYANSLSAFFSTIKTGLEDDKNIPVEIFGHSGNVNFDFLNAEASIGGTSETMKNILYDCTTALIIFAFVLWIISFIKRIF